MDSQENKQSSDNSNDEQLNDELLSLSDEFDSEDYPENGLDVDYYADDEISTLTLEERQQRLEEFKNQGVGEKTLLEAFPGTSLLTSESQPQQIEIIDDKKVQ